MLALGSPTGRPTENRPISKPQKCTFCVIVAQIDRTLQGCEETETPPIQRQLFAQINNPAIAS
jgi:hypothetical protein